ncbi:MAG: hypothetical protein ABI131_01715 [Nostocoides sp.]
MTALEELKGACGAAQARVTVAFDDSHRAAHDRDESRAHDAAKRSGSGAAGESAGDAGAVSPSRRRAGRGVAEMVALARRESPCRGDQHLGLAKALVHEMPLLHGLLTHGRVSEWVATKVVQGTATLSRQDRGVADARLASVLPELGPKGAAAAARRVAAELDAASVVKRMAAAARSRRVTVRPAADGMAYLTVLAPLAEAVGAFAALGRDADAVVGGHGCQPVAGRSRGQVMSDLAIQRLGGLVFGQVQPVEIQLVMTDTALFGGSTTADDDDADAGAAPTPPRRRGSAQTPVEVVGFGPVPAAFIRDRLRDGTNQPDQPDQRNWPGPRCEDGHPVDPDPPPTITDADPETERAAETAQVWLRRLYRSPDGRDLVAMDSRRRRFGGLLRQFLVLRDQTCRVPWCEAPIRAIDHAMPVARGGPTSVGQGDGGCVRHNNVKEEPGWAFDVTRSCLNSNGDHGEPGPHSMTIRTPAGTAYDSMAPPLLGWGSEAPEDDHPPRPLMLTENRTLEAMQSRLNRGEDFDEAEWTRYGYLTYLAAG